MEKWRKDYNRYMNKQLEVTTQGLNESSILHRCPYCSAYLWADKQHKSYNFCVSCGKNLKGKKLPYERI